MIEIFDIQSVFGKSKNWTSDFIQLSKILSIKLTEIHNIKENCIRSFSKSLNSNNILEMLID